MLSDLIVIYLGGWVVVTTGLFTLTSHFTDFRSPAPHPLGISILAGAVWPLLVLGVAEVSSVVAWTKVRSKPEPPTAEAFA
jgi:hypothetical protein